MSAPQSAICAESSNFAIFLTARLTDGAGPSLRRSLAMLPSLTADLAAGYREPALVSALSVGAEAWPALFGRRTPALLAPFEALADGPRRAPTTAADLFLHIHSPRHDINFLLAREVMAGFGSHVTLVEEVHGFRHLGGRDLGGFVDGTENPKGTERAAVALVGDEDPDFAGGSYVSLQRYVHNLAKWTTLPVPEQEAVIGRTKETDQELADEVKPPTAHIARVVIEESGQELEILRHSMPYGDTAECGLYFVAYGASPLPFRKMLDRMVKRDAAGHYDHLLDFTRPVTGASFFTPSLALLRSLAG